MPKSTNVVSRALPQSRQRPLGAVVWNWAQSRGPLSRADSGLDWAAIVLSMIQYPACEPMAAVVDLGQYIKIFNYASPHLIYYQLYLIRKGLKLGPQVQS